MTETEEAPQEEPDTPIEELETEGRLKPEMAEVVSKVVELLAARSARKGAEEREARFMEELLPLMRAKELHGVRLRDGTAVRRRWNPNRPTVSVHTLAGKLADWEEFVKVEVKVDQAKLHEAYPTLWRKLGGKETEGIAVFDPKKEKVTA